MAIPTLGAMIAAIGSPAEWGAVDTSKLYWDDTNGRLGIGAKTSAYGAFPEYMLHIRKDVDSGLGPTLCLQNSTYTNSAGAYSALRFQHVHNARYSEIRGYASGSYGFPYGVFIGLTDDSDVYHDIFKVYKTGYAAIQNFAINGSTTYGLLIYNLQQVTSGSPTIYGIGLSLSPSSLIYSGYTNAGYQMGIDCSVMRYDQGGSLDKGTLTGAYGLRVLCGHYGSEGTKVTTTVYGIYAPFYIQTGTVGTYYGLYMVNGGTGGTVTNRSYWIYTDSQYYCYRGGGSLWDTTSDSKMKKDIRPSTDGLNIIRQVEVKNFKWNGKCGHNDTETEQVGILAEELAAFLPAATFKMKHQTPPDAFEKEKIEKGEPLRSLDEDDGVEYWGYNLERVLFATINAVKELDARLDKLDKKSFADPNTWN